MSSNFFNVTAACKSTQARLAEMSTLHGKVNTPVFLPVGSRATVRSLTPQDLNEIGVDIILCNAYHLFLRPGVDLVEESGGLHKFMGWEKPVLTDSGGYQIFSLSSFRKFDENGVIFRSHIDGSEHHLTPEDVIRLQSRLGSDIAMVLDVCPESTGKKEKLAQAVNITSDWAKRCKKAHEKEDQLLFGIIQGGIYRELRRQSAEQIVSIDFPGYAIGGLSLGEAKSEMWDIVDFIMQYLPHDKPRYLMGVGTPEDILEGVSRGIDIFDSALPTRVARNGALYTHSGRKNIKRSEYKDKFGPIEDSCSCFTCCNFSAAYLHHLFKCEELLALRLATIHNLFFINTLIKDIRSSILNGSFTDMKNSFLRDYQTTDETSRIEQKAKILKRRQYNRNEDF